MKISLLDGTVREFESGLTVKEIATLIATSLGKNTIAAKINKTIFIPAGTKVNGDCSLEFVTTKSDYEKQVGAYTAALVAHTAIRHLFNISVSKVNFNLDGTFEIFIDTEKTFNKDDLQMIEKKANELTKTIKILSTGKSYEEDPFAMDLLKRYIAYDKETMDVFLKTQHLKFESYYISDFPERSFLPLCGMYEDVSKIKLIKVLSSSAYIYQTDSGDKVYQMIRGIGATNAEYVDEFLAAEEEKRKRDHRYIGKQLEIFTLDPLIGQGLPIWLPNGTILKDEIKKYLKEKEWEYDFIQVQTPVIGTSELYKTSGHWDHYRDDMFSPMALPKEEMVLKPMSCPHHIAVYNFKPRSYRDLPLRFAEHALQHRYESSGSLTGLERVRAMELTDSHIFCRPDQIKAEFKHAYRLIEEVLETFHIKVDYLSFSVRDPKDKEKYFDDDQMWNDAEKQLQEVLDELGVHYERMEGEAAFYGPKLDIQAKTVLGHEITVSTIQLDFLQPARFNLSFINSEGGTSRPVMIHRGLVGTYERFISVLLEQTGGVLPLWLAPRQVVMIPVNAEEHNEYCQKIRNILKKAYIRSEIDLRDERLNYKIRDAQVNKIPYTLVIGNDEAKNNTVTFRPYGSQDQVTMPLDQFTDKLLTEINTRK